MSFIESWDNMSEASWIETIAKEVQERKEKKDAIVSSEKAYQDLQDIAYEEKDILKFIYSTGVLFLIKNLKVVDRYGHISDVYLDELSSIVLDGPHSVIDIDVLEQVRDLVKYYLSVKDYGQSVINPLDFPINPDRCINLKSKKYTVSDLVGTAIQLINEEDRIQQLLFS